MTCVECRAIRADQMKELLCDNKENCREAYQDGYNQALEDFINKVCSLRIYDNDLNLTDLEEARNQLKK